MGHILAESSILKVFYVQISASLALQQTKPSAKRQAILATFVYGAQPKLRLLGLASIERTIFV
jgi:hypothetical protein